MVNPLAVVGFLIGAGGFTLGIPPVRRATEYWFNSLWSNNIPDPFYLIDMYFRGIIEDNELKDLMKKFGYNTEWAERLKKVRRQLLGVSDVIELYRRGELKKENAKKYLQKQGFSPEDAEEILKLSQRLLGAGDLVELLYREKIDETTYYAEMEKLGFNKAKADYIKELYKYVPSPSDFIRFAVREVFNEEVYKKYGYDQEFPEDIVKYAKWRGMDRQTLMWYWMAHWEVPSPGMAFEMLHRLNPEVLDTPVTAGGTMRDKYVKMGLSPENLDVDVETVKDILKIADYPPYWRDRLTAISYTPLTRVDLRRIYVLGLIDERELKARLMELGYSSDDAQLMVEFYKKYKVGTERDFTKSEILKLYSLRAVKRDTAKEMLMNLGYDDTEADYLLQLEDYKIVEKWVNEYIKTLETRYVKGLIDENQLRASLGELGLTAEEMAVYIERANRSKLRAEKMPSKEDLISMLKSGTLTIEEFKKYMKQIGWTDFWIDKYLKHLGVV